MSVGRKRSGNRRPLLIMMNGLTASGKSTVSSRLNKIFARCSLLRTCDIRKSAGFSDHTGVTPSHHFSSADKKDREKRDNVYQRMIKVAEHKLANGEDEVIMLDGSFNHRNKREKVYDLIKVYRIPLIIIRCVCNNEREILRRIRKRREKIGEAKNEALDFEVYECIRNEEESVLDDVMPDGVRPMVIQYDSLLDEAIFFNIGAEKELASLIERAIRGRITERILLY